MTDAPNPVEPDEGKPINHSSIDPDADTLVDRLGQQSAATIVATIPLGGPAGEVVASRDANHVYVIVGDTVKAISRMHHVVAAYSTGPHPKNILVNADGTRIHVTGYDGSTSIINTTANTVNTFPLQRSTAEVISPDGGYLYLAHSGIADDCRDSRISVVSAEGETVNVIPVDRHATGLATSVDGSRLYVSARHSSSHLDWRGSVSVIATDTGKVLDKIAVELAPDTIRLSRDGRRLYSTHYHKNAISIIDLESHRVTRRVCRDAPIDIVVSPKGAFAYVTNLHTVAVFDSAAGLVKRWSVGALPRSIALSADGKRAFVLDLGQRNIWALDTANNTVVGTVAIDGHPEAMALGLDGEFLYVTDYVNGVMKVISTARTWRRPEREK